MGLIEIIIIGLIVLAAAAFIARTLWKSSRQKGCGTGSSSCGCSSKLRSSTRE